MRLGVMTQTWFAGVGLEGCRSFNEDIWEFPKIGVPYLGVPIIRILLFRVLY